MKILGSVITKCNNKHFDTVVQLRYRSWFLGGQKVKTVFRHRFERSSTDCTGFSAWYDGETGKRLKDIWCYELDSHMRDKPDPVYAEDRKSAFNEMKQKYTNSKPKMFFDQNFRVFVAVAYQDAVDVCKISYTLNGDFKPELKQVQDWQVLHRKKYDDFAGRTAEDWADEFFNKYGVGYWGDVMEFQREDILRPHTR